MTVFPHISTFAIPTFTRLNNLMRKWLIVWSLLIPCIGHAQERDSLSAVRNPPERGARLAARTMVFKVEFAVPIVGNPYWNEYEHNHLDDDDSNPWFLPAGLNIRAGAGVRISRLFILGLAGGIESRLDHKLVMAPAWLISPH